jgi:hypothetical protein
MALTRHFQVQLKKVSECRCKELKKSNAITGLKLKCGCTCRCLVFESGKFVIIGVPTARHANEVFYRMRHMITAPSASYESGAFPLRKDQRHDARFAALLCAWGVPLTNKVKLAPASGGGSAELLDVSTAIAHFIDTTKTSESAGIVASAPAPAAAAPPKGGAAAERLTPFLKMCDAGSVSNVRFCIGIGTASLTERDSQGRNALERLEANPTRLASSPAHQTVLRLLKDLAARN